MSLRVASVRLWRLRLVEPHLTARRTLRYAAVSRPLDRLSAWINPVRVPGHRRDRQYHQDAGDSQKQSNERGEKARMFLGVMGVTCMVGIGVIVDRQRLYMERPRGARGHLWGPMDEKFVTLATVLLPVLAMGSFLAISRFAFVVAVIAIAGDYVDNVLLPHGQLQVINRGLPARRRGTLNPNASESLWSTLVNHFSWNLHQLLDERELNARIVRARRLTGFHYTDQWGYTVSVELEGTERGTLRPMVGRMHVRLTFAAFSAKYRSAAIKPVSVEWSPV